MNNNNMNNNMNNLNISMADPGEGVWGIKCIIIVNIIIIII